MPMSLLVLQRTLHISASFDLQSCLLYLRSMSMFHQVQWLLLLCWFVLDLPPRSTATTTDESTNYLSYPSKRNTDFDIHPATIPPCGLYLAESPLTGRLSLFAGTNLAANERIGSSSDALISMIDPNTNEWTPWHHFGFRADNLLEHALLDNHYLHEILVTGLTACIPCSEVGANVIAVGLEELDQLGGDDYQGTEQQDRILYPPAAGSFTQRPTLIYRALRPLEVGDELVLYCLDDKEKRTTRQKIKRDTTTTTKAMGSYGSAYNFGGGDVDEDEENDDEEDDEMLLFATQKSTRSLDWLQQNGSCIDYIYPNQSATPGIGRGAFSRRHFTKSDVITSSPVVYMDVSQLEILEQSYKEDGDHFLPSLHRDHGIEYTDKVIGQQILTNYVYGHPDSNLVLFPIAPVINWINHGDSTSTHQANAKLAWSSRFTRPKRLWEMPIMELFETPVGENGEYFVVDVVAIRDILPGEEIRLDYGTEWKKAWGLHVHQWETRMHNNTPVPARHILEQDEYIKTVVEQLTDTYPENLQTACIFGFDDEDEDDEDQDEEEQDRILEWNSTVHGQSNCLRPCDVLTRTVVGEDEIYYAAVIYPIDNIRQPEQCGHLPEDGVIVRGLPWEVVTLVDRAYAGITYQPTAFRQKIGIADDFFPRHWLREDPRTTISDFITTPVLPQGHLAPLRWSTTREVASSWTFRIGLPSQMHRILLDYCNRMGITEVLRHCTSQGNGIIPGSQSRVELQGQNWLLQRPDSTWRSNLHWLSPLDNFAHEDYLQALSVAGFDLILDGLAKYLNLQHLAVFEMSFIAVSFSMKGFLHHDFIDTGNKTFNILIPLHLANESAPEFDIMHGDGFPNDYFKRGSQKPPVGRYKYAFGEGPVVGDRSVHATSAIDYRPTKEMRLCASIYVSEIHERYLDQIIDGYTQEYPPRNDPGLLLSWAGRHWRHNDSLTRLPTPHPNHVLASSWSKFHSIQDLTMD